MRGETEKRIHDQGSGDIVKFAELDRGQACGGLRIFLTFSRSQLPYLFARVLAGLPQAVLSHFFANGPHRRLVVRSASHGEFGIRTLNRAASLVADSIHRR